jgi:hypothetical protein
MSSERLEQHLAVLIDDAAGLAQPPPAATIRRRGRRRRTARGAAILAVVVAVAVSVPIGLDRVAHPPLASSRPPKVRTISVKDWGVWRNLEQGWQLRYPRGWVLDRWSNENGQVITMLRPEKGRQSTTTPYGSLAVELAIQPATTPPLAPVLMERQTWTPPADTAVWSRWRRADGRTVQRGVIAHPLTPDEVRGSWASRADVALAVSPDVTPQRRRQLAAELRRLPGVRQVWYQSPTAVREQFIEDHPERPAPSLHPKIEVWLGYFYLRLDGRGRIAELRERYCDGTSCPERPIRAVSDFKADLAASLPAPAIYHRLAWKGGTVLRGKVSVSNDKFEVDGRTVYDPRDAAAVWDRYGRTGEAILATVVPLGARPVETVEVPATP